jgi:hypothetical protein
MDDGKWQNNRRFAIDHFSSAVQDAFLGILLKLRFPRVSVRQST